MNQNGQAYSAFKLLIAAIVAIAILYILMAIIGGIPLIGSDVQTATKQMIQKQVDMLGGVDTSTALVFKGGTNLAPSALKGNSGLDSDQVCVHMGDLVDNDALTMQGKTIMNNSTRNLEARVSVVCERANVLEDTLKDLGFEDVSDFDEDYGACECMNEDSTRKCCVVILRYA